MVDAGKYCFIHTHWNLLVYAFFVLYNSHFIMDLTRHNIFYLIIMLGLIIPPSGELLLFILDSEFIFCLHYMACFSEEVRWSVIFANKQGWLNTIFAYKHIYYDPMLHDLSMHCSIWHGYHEQLQNFVKIILILIIETLFNF